MVFENLASKVGSSLHSPSVLKNVKIPRLDLYPFRDIPLSQVTNKHSLCMEYASEIRHALKNFGIFEIINHNNSYGEIEAMMEVNYNFSNLPYEVKLDYLQNGQSYSGYIPPHYEITNGRYDLSEIYTVTKDIPYNDKRVSLGVPCHGPTYWPSLEMKEAGTRYINGINDIGKLLVKLMAISLDIDAAYFDPVVTDPWTHMRVLNYKLSIMCFFFF